MWIRITVGMLLFCGLSLLAQTPAASVVGRVTDSAGGVVPTVRVKLTNLETNQKHEVMTRDTGDFTAPNLAPGRYALEARQDGFQLYRRPEFTVAVDQVLRLDISLQVGAVSRAAGSDCIGPFGGAER